MSAIRLYVDEDAAEHAVMSGLRARGFDLLSSSEAGMLGVTDREQLNFAVAEGRSLYTFNVRDFVTLHSEVLEAGRSHAGIITIPQQRYSIGGKIRGTARFLTSREAEDIVDRIIFR